MIRRALILVPVLLGLCSCTKEGDTTNIVQVSPAPTIVSVTPAEAKVGASIQVVGTGFGNAQGTSTLTVGGAAATPTIWSNTSITATIPAGAAGSAIIVTVGDVQSNPGPFNLLWTLENPQNAAISTATASNTDCIQLTTDGAGGAIIAWRNWSGGAYDIYAQRVNGAGGVQWTADGVAISTAAGEQTLPQLVSDGAGGAIIALEDRRSGTSDIYAQRVNASGGVEWTADGVAISTAANDQRVPQLVSDGAGGAIIAWQDRRSGTYDIYAQRVNASGDVQWTADGLAISTAANGQDICQLVSDGAGGAIIVWQDLRSGTYDIYAQRVNALGGVEWTADGVAISTATGDKTDCQLTTDGAGGAIIAWQDLRGVTYDIYAQRVNALGGVEWTADGVLISPAADDQWSCQLVSDGVGGAIIAWEDLTKGDIYAQRVNASGDVQWTADGVAISTAAGNQDKCQLVSDGAGGAIIVWQDLRSGTYDIYAQRVNALGGVRWTADGVAISTAANVQSAGQLVSDGAGGAIIAWQDVRSGTNDDIYSQGISPSGQQ